jgi:V8-like Glu-specific endopeptidase
MARFILCLLVACSADVSDETEDPITGGSADRGHPAVVAIQIGNSALCTGSIVAPDVVLTARHCVSNTSESVACSAHEVFGDRDPRSMVIWADGKAVAKGRALVVPASSRLCGEDAAAIVLDRKLSIAPLSIGSPVGGEWATAVGFGKQGTYGPAGQKMKRRVRVLSVGARELEIGQATCPGDSGGPLLDAHGDIIGIVSRGVPPCDGPNATNIDSRADVHGDLVKKAMLR